MAISDLLLKPIDDKNLEGIANKNIVLSNPDLLNIIFRTCTSDLYPDSYLGADRYHSNQDIGNAYVYLRSLNPYAYVNKSWRGAEGKIINDFVKRGLTLCPVGKKKTESLLHFINAEKLSTLHFSLPKNKEMKTISNFVSQLTCLHIDTCLMIKDKHLVEIARLINLTTLSLGGTYERIIPIKQFTNLTSLSLKRASITKNTLSEIANLPNLKTLTFSLAKFIAKFKESPVIFPLTNLTSLDLEECQGFLNLTESINHLTNLTFLHVSDCCISDQRITNLDNLKNLTCLDLSRCDQIQEENLAKITALSELTYLDLRGSLQFSDNSLLLITKKLTNLTYLDITGCNQLSYQCISTFTNLKNLSHLGVLFPCKLREICSIPPGLEVRDTLRNHHYGMPQYRKLY